MFGSILIANRGEIACRIIRTARRMGLRTVAVYSDADAGALHVEMADAAIHIGPSPARESYLVGDRIIGAAHETGAEAVHPGFGFLSENADFAQAVLDAGLIWVGPTPASIRAMGFKDAAKKLMAEAGVPVTPGYLGEDQSPERLCREAEGIGYPVLIKAVAGGGGKGMRRVERSQDFAAALKSCQREAAAAFGDARVLIEKYVSRPRHIEVQVFGDMHGNVVHLFERDCSVQRRHQKVIEEAPAPGMDAATRADICAAAVRAAKAVDYVGAGTVEFIADASGGLRADRVWFMEMNTRLQVEHPVTEEITGVDLVEWQLRIAAGETLPRAQDQISIDGWAMEARLYAEDPAKDFLPSMGRLERFALPGGLRIETGVREGDEVTPFYDPMIAKLIAHGKTRDAAIGRLRDSCAGASIFPVRTNAGFLVRVLDNGAFRAGNVDTGLIAHAGVTLAAAPEPSEKARSAAAAAMLPRSRDAWGALAGFRVNAPAEGEIRMRLGDDTVTGLVRDVSALDAIRHGDGVLVTENGETWRFAPPRTEAAHAAAGDGAIAAPIPGTVTALSIADGDAVKEGQPLLVLEAMKMEYTLTAPFAGRVVLGTALGAQVEEGAILVRIEEEGA
ncbi:acetyl/propionyl/methylcrotonyl-CoA carboxylase subunit alpha [Pelagibacterium xiamenense]|uniref:acetyl/propionyl/methylcrotonyl-CoA carboxylase subunit alpha n=1 Tax=Pelagibacterium xiamenense TaxID=2901140 RepID=UPI001E32016D|nr:biotin carboxylase N-terminal domain-containing protein [Pelagibacterium xiamenense]MCD7060682.1 biotin/lipoyl-binding protein [Pelagibacterium xiamenense]